MQQCLHVTPAVQYAVDDDLALEKSVDDPIGLVVNLSVLDASERPKLLRNVAPFGKLRQPTACLFKSRQQTVGIYDPIVLRDIAVDFFDVVFRFSGKQNGERRHERYCLTRSRMRANASRNGATFPSPTDLLVKAKTLSSASVSCVSS